jgi:hypothetical protein
MSRFRKRLERLEQRLQAPGVSIPGVINWDNWWRRLEGIVPDGIVDGDALNGPDEAWPADECPIETAIAEAGIPAPNAGSTLASAPAKDEQPLTNCDSL